MKIIPKNITVRQLAKDYKDSGEEGVLGYGGKLDIRPPYQREFVYKDKQRDAVINTIVEGFPLNVMYWAALDDGKFEIIDGQQRTISVCQYVDGTFSHDAMYFHNLRDDKQKQILDYKLTVYRCSGTDSEKIDWFKIINIAGATLKPQELRNAVYSGSWVSDAKRYFSKTGCAAYGIASDYMGGSPIRQEYLETVIKWISDDDIENYMGIHQRDKDAKALWKYFQAVVKWIERVFTVKRDPMKTVDWGSLYNEYKDKKLDAAKLEKQVKKLMQDDEITKQSGIYDYVLTGNERRLSIRKFSKIVKQRVFEMQEGKCPICKKIFKLSEMEADHITPWSKGGKTIQENCQMLCKKDNYEKSGN